MAEGDESWVMLVFGVDELNHPGTFNRSHGRVFTFRVGAITTRCAYRLRGAHVWPDARKASPY